MSAKFTPGPWINDAPACVAKHWPEGGKATVCICPDDAEGQANALLIAAAPEMFDALEGLLNFPTDEESRTAARIALAKAKGKA